MSSSDVGCLWESGTCSVPKGGGMKQRRTYSDMYSAPFFKEVAQAAQACQRSPPVPFARPLGSSSEVRPFSSTTVRPIALSQKLANLDEVSEEKPCRSETYAMVTGGAPCASLLSQHSLT